MTSSPRHIEEMKDSAGGRALPPSDAAFPCEPLTPADGLTQEMFGEPTGDDPVLCHLCGKDTSLAMIAYHLEHEHGIDPDEIANAPIVSLDEESP